MKFCIFILASFFCFVLFSCSTSKQLMRCEEPAPDEIYACEDLKGAFKMCEKPESLYRCGEPN